MIILAGRSVTRNVQKKQYEGESWEDISIQQKMMIMRQIWNGSVSHESAEKPENAGQNGWQQLGRLSVRIVILVIAGWICLNLLRSNAVTAHADGNESETTSLIANVDSNSSDS